MSESFRYSMIVNQKLAFAKIQLDAGKLLLSDSSLSIDSRLKIHAYLDAAILELNKAFIFFVGEIADSNNAKEFYEHHNGLLRSGNLKVFLKSMVDMFPSMIGLQEMWTLINKPDSWLQRLNYYSEDPVALAATFVSIEPNALALESRKDSSVINVINLSALEERLSPEIIVNDLIREAHAFVDRHRANLEEY